MLKFLTQPVPSAYMPYHEYHFTLYVKSENMNHDQQKAISYFVEKLRKMLLDINKSLPRFANATWYTRHIPLDVDEEPDPTKVSLLHDHEGFIRKIARDNEDPDLGVLIYRAWDGLRSERVSAYFSYYHYFEADTILEKDRLELVFKVPHKFNYLKHWELGFSLEELEQIIVIANQHYDIVHASLRDLDFTKRFVPEDATEDYYEDYYNVFFHRFECVWMTVLDKKISADQLPQAAKVIPLEKGRTLVMSIADDYFSSYNPEHVLKANLLEIRLHELGLLRPFNALE